MNWVGKWKINTDQSWRSQMTPGKIFLDDYVRHCLIVDFSDGRSKSLASNMVLASG